MSIKQFNGNYVPDDDRLLFRFNTVNHEEYQFWFTRRVTQFILSATGHLVEKQLEQTHTPHVAKEIAKFQEESVKEKINFKNEYIPANKYPIGPEPVLVIDVRCTFIKVPANDTSPGGDVFSLDLALVDQLNLNLKLSTPILQNMRVMLERLNNQANWGQPILQQKPLIGEVKPEIVDETSLKIVH